MNRYFFFLLICIKLFFTLFCKVIYDDDLTARFDFAFMQQSINADERDIANIAWSYNKGFGFSRHVHTPDTTYYQKTSYRPFHPVLAHVYFQKLYAKFIAPLNDGDIYTLKDTKYYRMYGQIMLWLEFILTVLSLSFFRKLVELIFDSSNRILLSSITLLYVIFPSALIYMGAFPLYENIVLPCIVIIISILVQSLKLSSISKLSAILVSLLTAFVISIRPQVIMPLFIVFLFVLIFFIRTTRRRESARGFAFLFLFSLLVSGISVGQTLLINHNLWNKWILSTRGDGLLWGHNPLAKGSWDGTFDLPGSAGYKYQLQNIPGLLSMSDYESSVAKSNLALKNILSNPGFELWLSVRKLAIYFLPFNYGNHRFSILLFLTFAGFLIYGLYFLFNIKREFKNTSHLLLFFFSLAVIGLNIIFFVDYRFRYFSEPFMLILAAWIFVKLWKQLVVKRKDKALI